MGSVTTGYGITEVRVVVFYFILQSPLSVFLRRVSCAGCELIFPSPAVSQNNQNPTSGHIQIRQYLFVLTYDIRTHIIR